MDASFFQLPFLDVGQSSAEPGGVRLSRRVVQLPGVIMKTLRFGLAILFLGTFLGASELPATDEAFAPGTVGQWRGDARIVAAWSRQTNLNVTLDIQKCGAVTGQIGDARLTNGRLKKNPGWLNQKLKVKSDYIIVGKLEGAIVASEDITRSHVKIPLHLSDGVLSGGINTCSSKFGGMERMTLSATRLTLTRSVEP